MGRPRKVKLERSQLKTLLDAARGRSDCEKAKKYIEELDEDFSEPEPSTERRRGRKRSVLDAFLDWLDT